MMRIYILFVLFFLSGFSFLHAQQWTRQDSLNLHRILSGEGEVILNKDAVDAIRMETLPDLSEFDKPQIDKSSSSLRFNEELPGLPKAEHRRIYLSLRPYSAFTKYNEDPVQGIALKLGVRSMEMRYLWERRSVRLASTDVSGVLNHRETRPEKAFQTVGIGVGGLDFMAPFTKAFWKRKVNAEAWKTY